jgi:hypothetical protein
MPGRQSRHSENDWETALLDCSPDVVLCYIMMCNIPELKLSNLAQPVHFSVGFKVLTAVNILRCGTV